MMRVPFCTWAQREDGGCYCPVCDPAGKRPVRCLPSLRRFCRRHARRVGDASIFGAAPAAPGGPGTELHRLLARFGIRESAGCGCQAFAARMDAWGPAGCRAHFEDILRHLLDAASQRPILRRLPFRRTVARWLIDWAIRRAERLPRLPAFTEPSVRPVVAETRYLTISDLLADTHRLLAQLPADIDAVVAIARSGLLPGTALACLLHVPLYSTSPAGVVACGAGLRMQSAMTEQPRHVLLVDDTVWSGHALRTWRPAVRARFPDARISSAVVYAHPRGCVWADYWQASYGGTHYLEWNLFNAGHAEHMATDLDGVLCGEAGRPLQLPRRRPVVAIVTGRPEAQRATTEAWLARYGVRYRHLLMGPWPTLPSDEQIAQWKADQYRRLPASMFVESDPAQARLIHRRAARPVLCPALGGLLS